jgi:hypothetical protein
MFQEAKWKSLENEYKDKKQKLIPVSIADILIN